jgi:hypothetical protein
MESCPQGRDLFCCVRFRQKALCIEYSGQRLPKVVVRQCQATDQKMGRTLTGELSLRMDEPGRGT